MKIRHVVQSLGFKFHTPMQSLHGLPRCGYFSCLGLVASERTGVTTLLARSL